MFAQRHYIAIATVLADLNCYGDPAWKDAKQEIIDDLVTLFRDDNPRFHEQRFRDACELPLETRVNQRMDQVADALRSFKRGPKSRERPCGCDPGQHASGCVYEGT